jgi:hypothetical protein
MPVDPQLLSREEVLTLVADQTVLIRLCWLGSCGLRLPSCGDGWIRTRVAISLPDVMAWTLSPDSLTELRTVLSDGPDPVLDGHLTAANAHPLADAEASGSTETLVADLLVDPGLAQRGTTTKRHVCRPAPAQASDRHGTWAAQALVSARQICLSGLGFAPKWLWRRYRLRVPVADAVGTS